MTEPNALSTKEILDLIFKDPATKFELTEFHDLGKPLHDIITIYPKVGQTGKQSGQVKYYLESFVPFPSGRTEAQVYAVGGNSAPEEIIRQLWIYKLLNRYGYRPEEMEIETSVQFGTEVGTKAADIVVYTSPEKSTPKVIVECKKPNRKDGIGQLKSYMNAKGAPVALWSNGADRIILYRPYPAEFDDTLVDIPSRGQEPKDVLDASRTLSQLTKNFSFKKIVQDLEELVLADSGKDEFNEIFKLIFAKIWDEKEAQENRKHETVEFRKAVDPDVTYDRINGLFHHACQEWPGIFKEGEDIDLTKRHLQVCVGPIESVRLLGSNLRIMDDAFEYLLPTEAKKKKGQFFTPRHVVEMCVRMLNPTRREYVIDPACGSGGFLLHTMGWCYPVSSNAQRELRSYRYAAKYLWGIDFEERAARTSRALMLIAGDGHTNIFGPDVNSLNPATWYETASGQTLIQGLRQAKLTTTKIPENEPLTDDSNAWSYFDELKFDLVLANPPFAGEIKDQGLLARYDLARPAIARAGTTKQPKEERDVLFIERILNMLKPGGRAAIVLPQGKFNNSSLSFIREWLLQRARLLAVVGLHQNTFKPHTGTKTSVLFLQKHTKAQLRHIERIRDAAGESCPDYADLIEGLIAAHEHVADIASASIPQPLADFVAELATASYSADGDADAEPAPQVGADLSDTTAAIARQRLAALDQNLSATSKQVSDLDLDLKALTDRHSEALQDIIEAWDGTKTALREHLRPLRQEHRAAVRALKQTQKPIRNALSAELKALDQQRTLAERDVKLLSNRGRLEILLADDALIRALEDRWITAEAAKHLDYPIFMAVSERGGKNNSGDYEFLLDHAGHLVEFPAGHPQEGLLVVDQDLVNFSLPREDLFNAAAIPDDQICVAEAFVRFAQEHKLSFWNT